jgi:hypothetical protein
LLDLQILPPDGSDLCSGGLSPASVTHHAGNKPIVISAIGSDHTDDLGLRGLSLVANLEASLIDELFKDTWFPP